MTRWLFKVLNFCAFLLIPSVVGRQMSWNVHISHISSAQHVLWKDLKDLEKCFNLWAKTAKFLIVINFLSFQFTHHLCWISLHQRVSRPKQTFSFLLFMSFTFISCSFFHKHCLAFRKVWPSNLHPPKYLWIYIVGWMPECINSSQRTSRDVL
jgi:hypothetical protein